MSLGEDRVRVKFNPSATGLVDQIKQKTAELINQCNVQVGIQTEELIDLCEPPQPCLHETMRLWSIAQARYKEALAKWDEVQIAYEEAAMWAVKAATAGK